MVNEYHWYPSDGLNNKFNKKDDMKQDEDEDRDWLSKERKTTRFWGAKQNVLYQILNPTKKGSWVSSYFATYKDLYFSGKAG